MMSSSRRRGSVLNVALCYIKDRFSLSQEGQNQFLSCTELVCIENAELCFAFVFFESDIEGVSN